MLFEILVFSFASLADAPKIGTRFGLSTLKYTGSLVQDDLFASAQGQNLLNVFLKILGESRLFYQWSSKLEKWLITFFLLRWSEWMSTN